MTRGQRRAHAIGWVVLGPLLLVGIALLLANRPPATTAVADEASRETAP